LLPIAARVFPARCLEQPPRCLTPQLRAVTHPTSRRNLACSTWPERKLKLLGEFLMPSDARARCQNIGITSPADDLPSSVRPTYIDQPSSSILMFPVSDIDVFVYLVSTPANLTPLVPHQTDMSRALQGTSHDASAHHQAHAGPCPS
jgi:hypothetical protein